MLILYIFKYKLILVHDRDPNPWSSDRKATVYEVTQVLPNFSSQKVNFKDGYG